MLRLIREKATGWVAVVIVGLLIITFALWGINSYFGQGGEISAATINGVDITMRSYQQTFYNLRQQMQNIFKTTMTQAEEKLVKDEALRKLVEAELLNQVTADIGLRVSDRAVGESIKNLRPFQGENGFDRDIYEKSIANAGMTPVSFEQQMRLDMLSEQLQGAIAASVFVTSEETLRIASLKGQKRDIDYVILNTDSYREAISVSDEEIRQYYEDHLQQYLELEQVKIAFIDLDIDKLAEKVVVTDDDLLAYYENNKAKYETEEQRQVQQLYVKVAKDASEKELDDAKGKVESLRELVLSGKSFEQIVDEHANDPGPLFEYSEHGFVARGILPAGIDEILFAGKEADVSETIKTDKGFHIIKIGKIKGGSSNTFESLHADLDRDYRHQQAGNEFFEQADKLTSLAYEHPDTLDLAAEAIGAEIHESEFFSRNSEKQDITSESKIITASFSEDVMLNGNNSEAIELGDNRVIILRVIDQTPEKRKPLETVRNEVVDAVHARKASEKTNEIGQEIIKQLQAGTDPGQVAADNGFEWTYAEGVTREDVNVARSVVRVAFSLGIPDAGHPVAGGTSLGTGGYAIVSVRGATNPVPEDIKEEDSKTTHQQLLQRTADSEWLYFINDIRDKADIRISADPIQGSSD